MTSPATALTCVKCEAPLEKPQTGRPPRWCSTACRRSIENAIRRITRRLEDHEVQRDALTLKLAQYAAGHPLGRGTSFVARTNVEIEHHTERIGYYEARLREFYAGIELEPDGG